MRFLGRTAILPAVLATILCGGCKSSQEPGSSRSPSQPGAVARDLSSRAGNVYAVKYSPNTIVVEGSAAVKALQSVSADGSVFVFDSSEPALSTLAAGKVMLLERLAVRKVKAIQRDGSRLAVLTEPASLTETIREGTIRWNVPVHFAELGRQQAERTNSRNPLRHSFLDVVHADAGLNLSGEKNGWKYTIAAIPGTDRLNLFVDMAKNVNNIEVSMNATGYVPDFNTVASIVIHDSSLAQMDFQNDHLNGEVQMTISAATKGAPGGFGKKQVRLPAVLKAPFFLGALPFTLEISSVITFTPGLGANNQLMTAKFRVKYSDLHGFSFAGGAPAKQNGSSDGEGEILDAKGVTLAGIGVVAGVSMPRLEFKLGTSSLVDTIEKALPTGLADMFQKTFFGSMITQGLEDAEESIKTEGAAHVQVVLVGSFLASGPTSLIPCQKTTFSFRADAGADASVLGKSIGEVSIDLFKNEIVKTIPPNMQCG